MCQFERPLALEQLLDHCSDPASPCWECGWSELVKRFKSFLYLKVTQQCRMWNVPRLGLQFSDAVNDIVGVVFFKLCNNQCKALRDFSARNNERMFLAWLAVICSRATSGYIQKHFFKMLSDDSEYEGEDKNRKEIHEYLNDLKFDERWELYEFFVDKLRSAGQKKRRNKERNIHIFFLSVWADLSPKIISYHPCLRGVKSQMVYVVVERMRRYLHGKENS